jgi:hypothetical protein
MQRTNKLKYRVEAAEGEAGESGLFRSMEKEIGPLFSEKDTSFPANGRIDLILAESNRERFERKLETPSEPSRCQLVP